VHIPDGYLGPATYGTLFGITAPFWGYASWKLNRTLKSRQAPYLALGAAFSFVIMMFNIPVLGGTTGHATGTTLIAVLLGPWATIIAVSVALVIQALLFGDGGITALGANCFNIAVAGGLAGWGIYRVIAAGSDVRSKRRLVAAAIAAYLSSASSRCSNDLPKGSRCIRPTRSRSRSRPCFSSMYFFSAWWKLSSLRWCCAIFRSMNRRCSGCKTAGKGQDEDRQ